MELLQELCVTVIVAVLFSYLIAKLVSLGGGGDDSTHNSELSSKSQNLDQEKTISEDVSYRERLEVESSKSEKRVEFVDQDFPQKVDKLFVPQVIETECSELNQEDSVQEGSKENKEIGIEECSSVQNQNVDVVAEDAESKEIRVVDSEANKEKDEDDNKKNIEINENSDDDWEGIERSELEKMFAKAARFVEESGDNKDEGLEMELYGLHKVATEGPCHEQPPMALKLAARAKCDGGHCLRCARNAWQRLGNMNPEVAMEKYIALVSDKVPGWMEDNSIGNGKSGSAEEVNSGALASDFSTPNNTEERNPEATAGTEKNDLTGDPNLESRAKE